jgi:hypothetical protein
MRRRSLLALPAALLAGCAGFGGPRVKVIGESELQSLLAREFPRRRRVLEVLDVTLSLPRVRLMPERNRIGTQLDLAATERLSGTTLDGEIALDYALRLEPSDGTVRLTQVHVDRLDLRAAGTALPLPMQRVGALLAEHLLDDYAIWRAPPEQAELARRYGGAASAVTVTSRGVEITFAPR